MNIYFHENQGLKTLFENPNFRKRYGSDKKKDVNIKEFIAILQKR